MMDVIELGEPEFDQPNTVACTTLLCNEHAYTISTVDLNNLSHVPYAQRLFTHIVTVLGDNVTDNEEHTHKNYETMLFLDGESARYPFGDLPGNEVQGCFQRYSSKDAAREGHIDFVQRVQTALTQLMGEQNRRGNE